MLLDLESSDSLEPDEEEATNALVEEVLLDTPEEKSPTNIVTVLLVALQTQKEVVESDSGDDREGSNNIPVDTVEENKDNEDELLLYWMSRRGCANNNFLLTLEQRVLLLKLLSKLPLSSKIPWSQHRSTMIDLRRRNLSLR